MLSSVKSKLFLAKYSLYKPGAVPYFKQLLVQQSLSRDELAALNWQRTKALVEYAYENTPYYRRRFDEIGFSPQDMRTPDDFRHVPLLTRRDLQDNFRELVSVEAKPRDLRLSTTGGSTGEPVKVYHQKAVVRAATGWRMLSWWGLPPGVDFASIYRDTNTTWRARTINRLLWWPARRIDLDAVKITANDIRRFVEELHAAKPAFIHGYVGSVDYVASYLLDNQIKVPAPKAIWVTSAPLTSVQSMRIEKAFGAPVYDQYGCCEIYWLAAQCPKRQGLHMFSDIRRFEFIDDDDQPCPDGVQGRIVVTDLENRFFPIIRYLNGDMGKSLPGQCECGVTLPLMDKVTGRVSESVRLPDGQNMSGEYLTTIFDETPDAIRQFQVHQKADYSIEILVVPNISEGQLDSILDAVKNKMLEDVKHQVPVSVNKVAEIPQKGGKLRFIRSDVK